MGKRVLAVLLSVLLLLSLVTACSGNSNTSSTNSETESVTPSNDEVDLSVKRDVKIMITQNAFVTDYNDNWLTQKLEEDTNCEISMEALPTGPDALAKVQLMINGGSELPDIFSLNLSSALVYQYGTGGTFVALNDYYENEKVMPNWNAIESEDDKNTILSRITSADGNIYSLVKYMPQAWNMTPYRVYINQKWLDNLGLEVPTTTDELKNVLKAFREQDPNGNGQQDEIPLFTNYIDGGNYGRNVLLPLINSFVFCAGNMSSLSLSEDGKTIIAPQVTEEWKEAMKYLHSLYEVGGILPDGSFIPATDTSGFKGTLNYQGNGTETAPEGKSVNVVGLFSTGSNTGDFAGSATDENVNFLEYTMLPPLSNGVNEAYAPYIPEYGQQFWFITSEAEDPAFCAFLGDRFYTREMTVSGRFGQKDVDWTDDPKYCADWYSQYSSMLEEYADKGAKQTKLDYEWVSGVNAENTTWSEANNHFWHHEQPAYMDLDTWTYHYGVWKDPEKFNYGFGDTLQDTCQEYYFDAHPEYILPPLSYLPEEQDKITEFQVAYPDEIMSWTMKFITGEADIDGQWDAYKSALDTLGLQTYIECSQAAYERTIYYQSNFQ